MAYHLDFSIQSEKDIEYHKNSGNKAILKKILILLNELSEHPQTGSGKPELLKHSLSGYWSRRINLEHRLVYQILEDKVLIHSAKGHY